MVDVPRNTAQLGGKCIPIQRDPGTSISCALASQDDSDSKENTKFCIEHSVFGCCKDGEN